MAILEMAKRASKGGRVPIKIALLKIHDDPKETNDNGLHWDRNYVEANLETAKMIPICAEFSDNDKEVPIGHGLTGVEQNDNGIQEPQFLDSEVVGAIESASVEKVVVGGNEINALVGTGYLYNQRYPKFVKWVRKNFALGNVDSSIEVMGSEQNANKIVYAESNPSAEYRTPKEFVFSGTAILSVKPADENAIVLEVATKKTEENKMELNEVKELLKKAGEEFKSDELNAEIDSLKNQVTELNEKCETLEAEKVTLTEEKDALKQEVSELNAKNASLEAEKEAWDGKESELNAQIKKHEEKEKISELNEMLKKFSDAEQAYAKDEIDAFKKNPLDGNVAEINSKICVGIVEAQKEKEPEKEEDGIIDIFSEINEDTKDEDDTEDINIF